MLLKETHFAELFDLIISKNKFRRRWFPAHHRDRLICNLFFYLGHLTTDFVTQTTEHPTFTHQGILPCPLRSRHTLVHVCKWVGYTRDLSSDTLTMTCREGDVFSQAQQHSWTTQRPVVCVNKQRKHAAGYTLICFASSLTIGNWKCTSQVSLTGLPADIYSFSK